MAEVELTGAVRIARNAQVRGAADIGAELDWWLPMIFVQFVTPWY